MPADHNGKNLAESMKLVLNGWGLSEENQICIATDNGSNLVQACHLLNWQHISYFGHNLHLAITNAVKDDSRVARALEVIRNIFHIVVTIKEIYQKHKQTWVSLFIH